MVIECNLGAYKEEHIISKVEYFYQCDFHRKQCSSSQKKPSWAETQETTSVMRPIRNRSTLRLECHGADCFIQTKCCWQRKSALITGLICPFCGVCDVKRGPQSKHKNVTFPQRAAAYKSGEEGKAPPGPLDYKVFRLAEDVAVGRRRLHSTRDAGRL